MAQVYTSGNLTFKINSIARKEHILVDENNVKQATILINKGTRNIMIALNPEISEKDDGLFKNIMNCYNQFVEKNDRFNDFSLDFKSLENAPLEVYAIKKDKDSPIKMVTKEQIDQLDKNKVPYFQFLNLNGGFSKVYGNNKKCSVKNSSSVEISSPDELKDKKFFVELSSQYIVYTGQTPFVTIFLTLKDTSKHDKDTYISIPSIEIANTENDRATLHIADNSTLNKKKEYNFNMPLDLSKIDTRTFNDIMVSYNFDKETLGKTLKTLNNIPTIRLKKDFVDKLGLKTEPVESTRFVRTYNGPELLNELSSPKNELTNG